MDNVLNYACQYTKLSQELVEYVIGTCPKEFTERDSKAHSIPLTRKKQVTFTNTCSTSTNNTQKHGVHQKTQPSNVQVIPSTGVSSSTRASGSKPRSNTKHNRILPAKSVNNKKVEDHPRTNKSVWTKVNRVDSSISSKRVVINSNSESVCKTCNKCLNSANHEMCVVNILSSVNATPTVKIVLNKGKQIWKPKGKLSDNSLNKTKQVWKATGKLFANVGYQWRSTGKKVALGKLNCGYQWRPTGKKFALGELCPLTRLPVTCTTVSANQQDPNTNWGSEIPNPPNSTVFKCRCSGPEPKMMFGQNSSSLVLHQAQISSGLAPQCLKMFELSSSSLGLHCQKTFKQISSNLVSQMSQRRLLASLQAPFLKEKKGVRFSALYLQQKRNLLVLDHSHQQVSYFFHARSVVKWINVDQLLFWNTLTHDVKTGVYSFQVNEHWLTLSADLLRKALNVTPADSAHPFESPPADHRKYPAVEVKGKGVCTGLYKLQSHFWECISQETIDSYITKMFRDETLSHADAELVGGSNSKQSHVAIAGLNPEHMQDVFLATNYPKRSDLIVSLPALRSNILRYKDGKVRYRFLSSHDSQETEGSTLGNSLVSYRSPWSFIDGVEMGYPVPIFDIVFLVDGNVTFRLFNLKYKEIGAGVAMDRMNKGDTVWIVETAFGVEVSLVGEDNGSGTPGLDPLPLLEALKMTMDSSGTPSMLPVPSFEPPVPGCLLLHFLAFLESDCLLCVGSG
ncbi:hypothetical protein Tco_0366413 [Tanacetum coccineum]